MGLILASKIASDISNDLFDPDNDRFGLTDILQWINDGQRKIVELKPDANVTTGPMQLVAGTKQTLETGDIELIKITRNMGTDGTTPGKPIHLVNMDHFSLHNPGWQTDTVNATVRVYMIDDRNPRVFYNYPPQPTSSMGYVEKVVTAIPTDIAAIGDAITLEDQYEPMLYNYGMFRGESRNAKSSPMAQQEAVRYWNLFVTMLDKKELIEKIYSPSSMRGVKA
jgi:Family of unknown function (DUF6682)